MADPGFLKGGGADLTELYRNNRRQNRLSDSFVPSHNFKLQRPQRRGMASYPIHTPWICPCGKCKIGCEPGDIALVVIISLCQQLSGTRQLLSTLKIRLWKVAAYVRFLLFKENITHSANAPSEHGGLPFRQSLLDGPAGIV